MNIQKFVASTSREALGKARMAFGDTAVILSNKSTPEGVEVIATAEDSLTSLQPPAPKSAAARQRTSAPVPATAVAAPQETAMAADADAERLAMSTLSFQDYVRERVLRKRHEAADSRPPLPVARPAPAPAPVVDREIRLRQTPNSPQVPFHAPAPSGPDPQKIVEELQAMKAMIEDRFTAMAWLGKAQQHPMQPHLILKLLRAGFSPLMARSLLERLPESMGPHEAVQWLMQVLERNIRTDVGGPSIDEQGGIFAITGATGVGKTTTTAKIAAAAVSKYGANAVGLVTLDAYRVGAHDQLRAYGRALGVVAHMAHDRAALHDLLRLFSTKRMVLIDTVGMAPRDPRTSDMLDMLASPEIKQILVVAASMHGDSLDEVLGAFNARESAGLVLSKVDEAVKLGPPIDAIIRHKLTLRGVANGQRVPEDWQRADAKALVQQSMRAPHRSPFDPQSTDLGLIFAQSAQAFTGQEALHA